MERKANHQKSHKKQVEAVAKTTSLHHYTSKHKTSEKEKKVLYPPANTSPLLTPKLAS